MRKSSSQRWRGQQFNKRQIDGLFGVVNFSIHDVSKESDFVFKRLDVNGLFTERDVHAQKWKESTKIFDIFKSFAIAL